MLVVIHPSGSLFTETVGVLRAAVVDLGHGNEGRDWPNAVETPAPASVQWESTSEDTGSGNRVVTRMRLYVPATVDLESTDRVRHHGSVYEVDGDVETWPSYRRALLVRVSDEVG